MEGEVEHNCAVVVAHTLHDAYSFGRLLQHRGREATGIALVGYDRIDAIKWEGPIDRFSITDLHKLFPGKEYHTYLLHVRYATRGRKDRILQDAHPHTIGGRFVDNGSHLFVLDCEAAIVHNGQIDDELFQGLDLSQVKSGCDSEKLLYFFRQRGEYEIQRMIPGSFTFAIADKRNKDVIVARDRTGIKPGALGWKDGKYVVVSEDVALRGSGSVLKEELTPGCLYYLHPDGSYDKRKVVEPNLKYCFFEYNYVAHMLSILGGVSVRVVRSLMGEALAEEPSIQDIIPSFDLVTFMPRCPEPAAYSFAEKIGKPFEYVFYKSKDERAFQGSTLEERASSIKSNLFLIPGIEEKLDDKIVAVIDDSIIRGNNSRHARDLLYNKGKVKTAFWISYTPQVGIVPKDGIKRGCMMGVDMPPDDVFIARDRTIEGISENMGMPVRYLSLDGMLKVFERLGIKRDKLCYFCVGGEHPFVMKSSENQRNPIVR